MADSVRTKLVHGVVWNFTEKILVKAVSFAIGVILARLLSPSDYGLMGMMAIFLSVSSVFIEGGFAKALIQRQNCQDIDYSTAFVTNVSMSLIIYVVLFFAAPFIATFYEEPILKPLTRVMGLTFVLGSFNIVQRAKLMKNVDFKSLAQINVLSILVTGAIGIGMAYQGFGVWALVGQAIGQTLFLLLIFPFYSKWKPSLRFSKESFSHLFGFGSKLMITEVYSVIFNNIATMSIGKVYKSKELGYYTRGSQFSDLIAFTINDVLGTVTFPVLSGLQDDKEHMVTVYRKTLFVIAMVIFPVMVLCALLAYPLVLLLLTEKWLPAVVLMQWLCLARMFMPLSALNMNILNAIGRSDLFMKLDFAKAPLTILILSITIPIGVKAIVIGTFVESLLCFFINAYLPGRMFGYGALKQLKDWRYIFLSIVMMVITVFAFLQITDNAWLQLLVGGTIGIVVYIVCCYFFKVIDDDMLRLLKIKR